MTNGSEVAAPPALTMTDVSKRFGPVQALRGVSVTFRAGEVTALMGENGAGKSTLLKVLTGAYPIDSGSIELDGVPVRFPGPAESRRAGIRVVGQEPEIVGQVTVAENIYLGALPANRRLFNRPALLDRTTQLIERYGFGSVLHAGTLGSELTPAQRQIVEILRALTDEPKVIAFDEPTSSLSDTEVDLLFALIAQLRDAGVAVVYVSHRMKEIFTIADRITVLRDGAHVGDRVAADTDGAALIRMMVGRDLSSLFHEGADRRQPGEVVLDVRGLRSADVHDITFAVRAGEIVGLAGLVGAGRSELAQAIIAARPITAGDVTFQGNKVHFRSPRDSVRAGIGMAPEERKAEALFLQRSIKDNAAAAIYDRIRRFRVVNGKREKQIVTAYTTRLRVRAPSTDHLVGRLSGGNQQKVVLARWLARQPALLILDEPTRGIDIGAKSEIYSIIREQAKAGMAILMISSELPEILGLADRILVMQNGRITGELTASQATEESVLALAMVDDLAQTLSQHEDLDDGVSA